jgi:aspartate aminotransferase-like enzyme
LVAEALDKNPGIRAVYATASETSTATKHDVESIAKIVKAKDDVILAVDAITAVGVFDVPMDKWGLDVVAVGSQKALMLPPGLGIIAVSEKAWKANERSNLPRFYLDLMRERKSQEKGETAFTPAVSLVVGLRESLRMLKEETLEGVWNRHERLAKATRAAAGGLGLELFSASPTNSVTGIRVPNGVDGSAVVKNMRTKYGITIAGGQDHLKGKIVRIAHIGYFSEFDIITAISGLEMTLSDLGYGIRPGSGVASAQAVFAETRKS